MDLMPEHQADAAHRNGKLGVEPFDAAYGAGFQAEDDSRHAVECELVEDAGAFELHRPPAGELPHRLAFVDGTMRTEQPVAKVRDPAWSGGDRFPYTEDPWRWARDRQYDRGRRSG